MALNLAVDTAMIVHQEDNYLGIIAAMDIARPEAVATLAALKKMGIKRMIMLTGDHQKVADAIAKDLGITEFQWEVCFQKIK